jgi:protein-disulfide isomerase
MNRPALIHLVCLTGAALLMAPQAVPAQTNLAGPVIPVRDTSTSIGLPDAPVTIVEFSDFQCPRCGEHFVWTLGDLVTEYVKTGKVRYIIRDYPLESIHPLALKAAEGAHCAGDQGKYWEMHNRLFSNQAALAPKMLALHAAMLRLDVAKFETCLNSGAYTAKVRQSVKDGKEAGVGGTPWFFLGLTNPDEPTVRAVVQLEGVQPYAVFSAEIQKLLAARTASK